MRKASAIPVLLVIRNTGLGDLLMQVPALRALRQTFPGHHISMTCPSWLSPLVEHMCLADSLITEMGNDRRQRERDPAAHLGVDASIVHNVSESSVEPDVIAIFRPPRFEMTRFSLSRRPRKMIAFQHPDFSAVRHLPVFDEQEHILHRWERMLNSCGIAMSRNNFGIDIPGGELSEDSHRAVLHVGAGSASRRWPLDRWGHVARVLTDRGSKVLLTGSRSESHDVATVLTLAGLPSDCDVSGNTDVMDLMRLVSGARLVISADTGVAHVATALRRRSLTLFGPVPPSRWGPPPGDPLHRVLWSGRTGEPYGKEPDPGLLEISAEGVVRSATDGGWA